MKKALFLALSCLLVAMLWSRPADASGTVRIENGIGYGIAVRCDGLLRFMAPFTVITLDAKACDTSHIFAQTDPIGKRVYKCRRYDYLTQSVRIGPGPGLGSHFDGNSLWCEIRKR